MKHIYKFIFILIALVWSNGIFAQHLPIYSQYIFNRSLINPAATGDLEYNELGANYRQQWSGIKNAPSTQTITGNFILGGRIGLGGILFNDIVGPERLTGGSFNYAYHLPINDGLSHISLGLSASLSNYNISFAGLNFEDKGDVVLQQGNYNKMIPDAGFGIYWYGDQYYLGLAAQSLFYRGIDIKDDGTLKNAQNFNQNYVLNTGYKFGEKESIQLEPSVFYRFNTMNQPDRFDVNLLTMFYNRFGLGVSYRNNEIVAGLVRINIGRLAVGYSYEYPIANNISYFKSTNEVSLLYRINYNKYAQF